MCLPSLRQDPELAQSWLSALPIPRILGTKNTLQGLPEAFMKKGRVGKKVGRICFPISQMTVSSDCFTSDQSGAREAAGLKPALGLISVPSCHSMQQWEENPQCGTAYDWTPTTFNVTVFGVPISPPHQQLSWGISGVGAYLCTQGFLKTSRRCSHSRRK